MSTARLIGRVLGTVIMAVVMIGFGLCGAAGLFNAPQSRDAAGLLVICGIVGIAIAASSAFVIYRLWRRPPDA